MASRLDPTSNAPPLDHSQPTNNAPPLTPHGIAACAQSSINSQTESTDYWKKVSDYAVSLTEFIRNLVISALEGIRSALGGIVEWMRNKISPSIEENVNWEIPVPQNTPEPQTVHDQGEFFQLPISDTEKQNIFYVVHTIGSSNWFTLFSKKQEIEQAGIAIQYVHPLRFLEYVFLHPSLPNDMQAIANSPLTWDPFMNGLKEKMRREASTLMGYKEDFARSLNVAESDLDPYFANSNWEGLVKFLMDVKTGKKISIFSEPQRREGAAEPVQIPSAAGLSDLPFSDADQQLFQDLISKYETSTRASLIYNHTTLLQEWQQIGNNHPLKLLLFLYQNPNLLNSIKKIEAYYGTSALFINAITTQLARVPHSQFNPYLEEFASVCHLNQDRLKLLVQNNNWKEILSDLIQNGCT